MVKALQLQQNYPPGTFCNIFAAGSTPAWDRLIDLTLEGHGLAMNVLKSLLTA